MFDGEYPLTTHCSFLLGSWTRVQVLWLEPIEDLSVLPQLYEEYARQLVCVQRLLKALRVSERIHDEQWDTLYLYSPSQVSINLVAFIDCV